MNFFDYQDRARKWTRWLIGLYALSVVLTILAVNVFVTAAVGYYFKANPHHAGAEDSEDTRAILAVDSTQFAVVSLILLAIIVGGSLWKMSQLSGGGEDVARLMGGSPLGADTADEREQQLRNIVEEMAIASGVPVPQIFVLRDERGINAFAAGHTTHDAAITVTRGALQHLTRDELQGVIGHEFSHILNGDMRMNIRLTGLLYGLLMIALTGYGLVRLLFPVSVNMDDDDAVGRGRVKVRGNIVLFLFVLGLGLLVIGYIGVFFANLIKAAIGREREFLADASSAQFTRNPHGLAGALEKIGALTAGGCVSMPEAAQVSHFFFAEPGVHSWLNFFDTHPPLDVRIQRLDPAFSGDFSGVRKNLLAEMAEEKTPIRDQAAWEPLKSSRVVAAAGVSNLSGGTGNVAQRVGAPDFQSMAYAASLLKAIPEPCRRAVADVTGAQAVLFAMLLSRRAEIQQAQMLRLASTAPGNVYLRLPFLAEQCHEMPPAARLPLADLAVSTLRALEMDDYKVFRENLLAVVKADSEVDLFEFTLLHMIGRRLDRFFGLVPPPRVRFASLTPLNDSVVVTLAALAWNGSDDAAAAQAAYDAGWLSLGTPPPGPLPERTSAQIAQLEVHLARLADVAPQCKAQLLAACSACANADGHMTLCEAETLRAIADALDCPVPPFALEADAA